MFRTWLLFSFAVIAVLAGTGGTASAQVGGRGFPAVGAALPEVTLRDDRGEEFSTAKLRGHYTVLVFGCLT